MQYACDAVGITLNKNTIHGDSNALNPGAVRIGTAALTSRGFKEADFEAVTRLLIDVLDLCKGTQSTSGKRLADFKAAIDAHSELPALRARVSELAKRFPMPGL